MVSTGAYGVSPGWTAAEYVGDASLLTFIQLARGCAFSASALELLDLAPITVCVGSPPEVSLMRITTSAFLDLWSAACGAAFAHTQRGALVSLVDPGRHGCADARLLLSRPRIHLSGLRYDSELVGGELPPSSGSCALFIEPGISGPLSQP